MMRKLRMVAEIARVYPKIRLVTSVGIGELVANIPLFLSQLKETSEEADFWRLNQSKYAWKTTIKYKVNSKNVLAVNVIGDDETSDAFKSRQRNSLKRARSAYKELGLEIQADEKKTKAETDRIVANEDDDEDGEDGGNDGDDDEFDEEY